MPLFCEYSSLVTESDVEQKLQEAEEAVKDESAWMSFDEVKASVGI